jgi:hypothetical protein
VLHHAGVVVARGVVHGVRRELPVLQEQRSGGDLAYGLVPAPLGQEQDRRDQGREQHRHRGREQPHGHPAPAPGQVERAVFGSADELICQQEAGDDEEDVDAAGDPAEPDVVDDDQPHREGAQALQLRSEDSGRCGWGRRPRGVVGPDHRPLVCGRVLTARQYPM